MSRRSHISAETPRDFEGVSDFVRYKYQYSLTGCPLRAHEIEICLLFCVAIYDALAEVAALRLEHLASHHRTITGACEFLVAA